jgi:PST family polysaccharide transporter
VSNTFVLGLFTNNTIVGYYSGAEKIIKAVQGLLNPVSQTIYPYISKLAQNSKEQAIQFIKKIIYWGAIVSFFFSLLIFIFSPLIVKLLLGNNYQESVTMLRIFSFLPFIIFLTNMFGAQLLLPFNIKKIFTSSVLIPAVLHVILLLFITPRFKEIGVSIVVVFTECMVLGWRIVGLYLFHKNLLTAIISHGKK